MITSWIVAWGHLLALAIGFGAIWSRRTALVGLLDDAGIRRVLTADTWWGVAALVWVGTGLVRLFGGTDKVTDYYLDNWMFWAKMVSFVVVVLHEIRPAITFVGWRKSLRAGQRPDTSRAARIATVSAIQAFLVIVMVALATAMARGWGSMAGD